MSEKIVFDMKKDFFPLQVKEMEMLFKELQYAIEHYEDPVSLIAMINLVACLSSKMKLDKQYVLNSYSKFYDEVIGKSKIEQDSMGDKRWKEYDKLESDNE